MGTRKNIKFLNAIEQENFVRACVMMKANIVNPAAPANQQYSKWDEYVAIHQMIQNAFGPSATFVNFGHGGTGAFSFLSWHRYFLYRFELDLQSHVPGVMLPYWDWTDPASTMTDTFLGPNGSGGVVPRGYFAFDRPGAGSNTTALPAWWPASLVGWRLPNAFGSTWQGGLRRNLRSVTLLPTVNDVRETLAKNSYSTFQNALESGSGLSSGNQMHNGMHGWIGGLGFPGGHMSNPAASPFDPFFYLHHCNIDRLWAMWQMDGHSTEYPTTGGDLEHHRNDIMYPWTGGTAGYGTNASIAASIPMPDFSALGAQRNVDTLDFRSAYGYTYDTLAVIGIGLDRTGSMNGLTPDPMTSGAPDVTKWEAATRGVSAFLQDCETVQNSGVTYVLAGIKTFRRIGASNDFASVFPSPNYGLVKTGTSFSKATFDSSVSGMSPDGSTPLADALQDVQTTLVEPPFGGIPADEQRYLAMLTDGVLTSGSPMNSIPNGSFSRTAIFAMGFGTGADVDYATLASMVAKGRTLTTPQVFHGENAGTIDKFYSNALASAIGFTTIVDPVVELFAGEHTHLDFQATSADDVFFITAQGMDFNDGNWMFHLHGPGGSILYGDPMGRHPEHDCQHCCPQPQVTAIRDNGRLSIVIQRDNASAECWVGTWRLMAAYKAQRLDAMLMPELGELLFPVSAGPVRGARYARLLQKPMARKAKRNVVRRALHTHDVVPVSTNHSDQEACDLVVNIYARTRLRVRLQAESNLINPGTELKVTINNDVLAGRIVPSLAFARLIAPSIDLAALVARTRPARVPAEASLKGPQALRFDPAMLLAMLEKKNRKIAVLRDKEVELARHDDGPLHIHDKETNIPGVYHLGVYVEGIYYPGQINMPEIHTHHGAVSQPSLTSDQPLEGERFTRLLNISIAAMKPKKQKAAKSSKKTGRSKRS